MAIFIYKYKYYFINHSLRKSGVTDMKTCTMARMVVIFRCHSVYPLIRLTTFRVIFYRIEITPVNRTLYYWLYTEYIDQKNISLTISHKHSHTHTYTCKERARQTHAHFNHGRQRVILPIFLLNKWNYPPHKNETCKGNCYKCAITLSMNIFHINIYIYICVYEKIYIYVCVFLHFNTLFL